jgi:hypothetical protein
MSREEILYGIHNELLEAGYSGYANLLSNYLLKSCDDMGRVIGVAGDDLTGKSSIINELVGTKLLPTSVIPSRAGITITTGDKDAVIGSDDLAKLAELIEEAEHVEVVTSNEFMKRNLLTIKEFHGLISREKSADLALLSAAYKCDEMIFVISAEHLLSESESIFIENYIKYVGAEHLLLVINKVDLLADSDVTNVLDYAKSQIETRFEDVKWILFDRSGKRKAGNCGDVDLKTALVRMVEMPRCQNETLSRGVLSYISDQLGKERVLLEKDKEKKSDEIIRENEKLSQKKKMEEATIEGILIEFKQKKNVSIEKIDSLVKEAFETIANDLLREYDAASNKYVWYEEELERNWKVKVASMSKRVDKAATEIIVGDVDWINSALETKLGMDQLTLEMASYRIADSEKIVPYSTYKKFVPIGTGGIVVIGFKLFRMIGAAVGLGGGLLAYAILEMRNNAQNDEIKNRISSRIRDISFETRKMLLKEIEAVYKKILYEFEKEAKIIVETKYQEKAIDKDIYDDKIIIINNIISHIEEVI